MMILLALEIGALLQHLRSIAVRGTMVITSLQICDKGTFVQVKIYRSRHANSSESSKQRIVVGPRRSRQACRAKL